MIIRHLFARTTLIAALVAVIALVPGPLHAQPDSGTGQIAIAGPAGNIHLYNLSDDSFTQLTTDAQQDAKFYAWPTWSTDGQLAYFGVDTVAQPGYSLGIFIRPAVGGEAVQVYDADDEVFTYAYWSPADCPAGNCRDLAVLYTAADSDLAVRRVRSLDTGVEFEVDDLADGSPFYWDWSFDGQSMFWARNNRQLEVYDVASDSVIRTLDARQGFQRAVDWSPVDDRLLSAIARRGRSSALVVFDGDEQITLADDLRGLVAFEWSPDGSQVAYADGDGGNLYVVDARTGDEVMAVSDNVVGFFWSPDGRQIAYITLTREDNDLIARRAAQSTPVIRWHVHDLDAGASQRFASFLPSRDMIYYLQFYDQFARSHRLWSPDSRYIVYGETARDGTGYVTLIDTTAAGAPPERLMPGRFGVFAWD